MAPAYQPGGFNVLETWACRLGHHVSLSDRLREGRAGVFIQGTLIPFRDLDGSPTLPLTTSESTFGGQATLTERDLCGARPSVVNAWADAGGKTDEEGSSRPPQGATSPLLHATVSDPHDGLPVDALLSYLAFHTQILDIADKWGLRVSDHTDVRRGSVVVITQVNTIDNRTLKDILRMPPPDRTRIARRLFEATAQGSANFTSIPGDDHADTDRASELRSSNGCGEVKAAFPLACSEQDSVNDVKPAPAQAAVVSSTSDSAEVRDMFIHYARAMERQSAWRRGEDFLYRAVDNVSYAADVADYWFVRAKALVSGEVLEGVYAPLPMMKDDYFPLDVLLKYMLEVAVSADIAVASTVQLLEIFEKEDKMPVRAEDIRQELRRVRPVVILKERCDSSGRTRQVALLSRALNDAASTTSTSDETLYQIDLDASKSKEAEWDEWDDVSLMSEKKVW